MNVLPPISTAPASLWVRILWPITAMLFRAPITVEREMTDRVGGDRYIVVVRQGLLQTFASVFLVVDEEAGDGQGIRVLKSGR